MPAKVHASKPTTTGRGHRPLPAPTQAKSVRKALRPKLKLGATRDEAEKQADRIAARALKNGGSMAHGLGEFGSAAQGRAEVRRALASPADGQLLDAPAEEEQALPEALEHEIIALAPGGEPLPPPLRSQMEARFGLDLSAVRIHRDGRAARLNEALHAHAFTVGEHIAFNTDRFRPKTAGGRFLLAHELAHVAQHRGEAGQAERLAVRRGFWSDLYHSAVDTLGDIADWAIDKVREYGWRLLESISPEFARTVRAILDEGILTWLGRQVARAWDAYIGTLRALVPFEGPRQLIDIFAGLVERAARIAAALASGNCRPLMAAITDLKTFVTETVGVAWSRLVEFLRPVGDFFRDLWANFGAPAVRWLRDFGGSVWQGVQDLGRRLWAWIRPVRDAAARIWNWFSDLLFGPSEGEDSTGSQGGVLGWISRKAGEAWDWVKERTRPVWQPVASFARQVADLLPPAFVREMGQSMQQLSGELDSAAAGMDGGAGVPRARESLAAVLPSVRNIIAAVRRTLVGAGRWLAGRLGTVAAMITGVMERLRASDLLSWLAGAFGWLSGALESLVSWARDQVSVLFAWLVRGFDALTPFLAQVLETVRKLVSIAADLLQLPLLILSAVWRRVPACIREPIENFIRNQILARIPVFGQFFSDPELWPRVRQTALDILRRIFVDGDLARAAWAFFQAVLRILGIPAQLVIQILAKAARAIGDILTNPIGFLINTLRAVRAGFARFFGNIGTHLLNGVTGWLFGRLREAGIRPPADFSLRSVLGFVLDVLGITADNVFRRLAARVGQAVVSRLRRMLSLATGVWSFVSVLIREGPAGLWRELRERLSSLWGTVVQGVISWITEVVITRASVWLLSLLDPSGITAVINSLIAIYRAIESFVQYLRQMLEIVSRVLDGILDIARGAIAGAARYLENALSAALPVAIGFLANQLGLGRISARIREILVRVHGVVDGAIDWLIDRALRTGRALLDMARRGTAAVRGAVGRARDWWRARRQFRVGGEAHTVFIRGSGAGARVMVASAETPYSRFIHDLDVPTEKRADKERAVAIAGQLDQAIAAAAAAPPTGATAAGAAPGADHAALIDGLMADLAQATARIMPAGGGDPPSTEPVYGPVNSAGYGTSATVLRLTRNRSFRGSTPDRSLHTPAYSRLNQRRYRRGSASAYYVLGHLLNHNLGGPGTTWRNLTPLSQGANNRRSDSMLHGFEKQVKDAVDRNRQTVNFVVTANYGMPQRGGDAERALSNARNAGTDEQRRFWLAVREVAQEEARIPRSVSLSAHTLRSDGSRGERLGTQPEVDNVPSAERNIDAYEVRPRSGILEEHSSEL